mgnify:CR=1 FL=1
MTFKKNMLRLVKIIIISLIYLLHLESQSVLGQQDAHYTQYIYSTMVINPAYAGSNEEWRVNLLHRTQWLGIDGAPSTQVFSVDFPARNKVGLGLSFGQDAIGPSKNIDVNGNFSYTINLFNKYTKDVNNRYTKLAFGLKAGIGSFSLDLTELNPKDFAEPFINQKINELLPVVGIGVFVYDNRWYAGLSSPNVLESKHYSAELGSSRVRSVHIYAMGGYVHDFRNGLELQPTVLLKMAKSAPISIDIAANLIFNRFFVLGASYRLGTNFSALTGFQVNKELLLGYAYDFDTSDLGEFSFGSHEFFIRYRFSRIGYRITPRFY